jgi:hypothetical protein
VATRDPVHVAFMRYFEYAVQSVHTGFSNSRYTVWLSHHIQQTWGKLQKFVFYNFQENSYNAKYQNMFVGSGVPIPRFTVVVK